MGVYQVKMSKKGGMNVGRGAYSLAFGKAASRGLSGFLYSFCISTLARRWRRFDGRGRAAKRMGCV